MTTVEAIKVLESTDYNLNVEMQINGKKPENGYITEGITRESTRELPQDAPKYRLIHSANVYFFESSCEAMMRGGWCAQGGSSVIFDSTLNAWVYFQAFVKVVN